MVSPSNPNASIAVEAVEDCFRPVIVPVTGMTRSEIESEVRKLWEANKAITRLLSHEYSDEEYCEFMRELEFDMDSYIKVANANLDQLTR